MIFGLPSDRLVAIAAVLATAALGRWRLGRDRREIADRQQRLKDFGERFRPYVESGGKDDRYFVELLARVDRLQKDSGAYGYVAAFKPPGANYALRNYAIFLNALPAVQQWAHDPLMSRSVVPEYLELMRQAAIRYGTSLTEELAVADRVLGNPLQWFVRGVRAILATPVLLLEQFGLLPSGPAAWLLRSAFMRVVGGVLAVIGFVSGIVTITTGWSAFVQILRRLGL